MSSLEHTGGQPVEQRRKSSGCSVKVTVIITMMMRTVKSRPCRSGAQRSTAAKLTENSIFSVCAFRFLPFTSYNKHALITTALVVH